jgi:hypothetical protein
MVAVGDSNQVFLYDISVAGGYQKIGTYTGITIRTLSCKVFECSYFAIGITFVAFVLDGSDNGGKLLVCMEPIVREVCRG